MTLNHLHLHVRDTERSKRFFGAWLGFVEKVRHGDIPGDLTSPPAARVPSLLLDVSIRA